MSKELFKVFYKPHNGLCDRLARHKLLKFEIEKIITDKWKICIDNKFFKNIIKIDHGSFGDVYKVRFKEVDFILKEVYIAPYMLRKLGLTVGKEWEKNQYPPEAVIGFMTNDILESGESPNFVYMLGSYFCKPCKVRSICYNLLTEEAEGNLTIINQFTSEIIDSAVAQLLMGLNVLHKKYGLIHKDIKAENILIKRVHVIGCFRYETEKRIFYIPNQGYIFMLADFGISSSIKPCYAFDAFLGTRNFKVESLGLSIGWGDDAGIENTLKPFNVKFKPIFSTYKYTVKHFTLNAPINRWVNKEGDVLGNYTENSMSAGNLEPELKLDLNDVVTFPAIEFVGDIQDVLRIFAGGYRYFQPYFEHPGWEPTSQRIKNLVTYRNCVDLQTTDGKALKYISADITVAFLFPQFKIALTSVVDDFKFISTL
ncbi:serine/threonine protein kinase [lymphocystis disease virus-China]|uniref:Serine/threonine protein kinase n=2 Tax=Lymphocystis disease virus 2 TaxID=159183 RepID=A0A6F8WZL3_9VIRU|nr:serine/threonine protein kinase [lymphocystis disease virus-China]AAU10891.1 serine/threonine protein kinase [lymphocystis disease virus-China]BCB67437.1 serine/threonine protein kinase [Lymphocystis disease virus 2]